MNDEIKGTQTGPSGSQAMPGADDSVKNSAGVSETQSLAADLLKEILPTLTEETQKVVNKELQSFKDKRLHAVPENTERIGSLEDTTRRLMKHIEDGKTPAEAENLVKAEVRQEQFFNEFDNLKDRVENFEPGRPEKSLAEREQVVLQSLGLNPNDPSVLKIQQEASSPDEYVQNLEKSWWDMKNKPRGSAADLAPTQGGAPITSKSEAELMADYQTELDNLKTTRLAGDVKTVQGIRKKYIDLGLAGKI